MKISRRIEVKPADYEAVHTHLRNKFIPHSTIWDNEHQVFIFEYTLMESYTESVLNDLHELQETETSYEHKDSLNFAISAIKTLIDMGVIK